jgi:hypothetical protein
MLSRRPDSIATWDSAFQLEVHAVICEFNTVRQPTLICVAHLVGQVGQDHAPHPQFSERSNGPFNIKVKRMGRPAQTVNHYCSNSLQQCK